MTPLRNHLVRAGLIFTALLRHIVSPPLKLYLSVLQAKEYDDACNCDTARPSGRQDKVVLRNVSLHDSSEKEGGTWLRTFDQRPT